MFWPPWYSTTNNIANFDPRFYDPARRGGDQSRPPAASSAAAATTASSWRATASRTRATTSTVASGSRRCRRCSAASRAASRRRTTTSSSRASACPTRSTRRPSPAYSAGVFHNRVTLNDSTAARRQPAVPADGRGVERQRRQSLGRRRRRHRSAVRDAGAWTSSSSTRRRTCGRRACSARCRSGSSSMSTYVGRRGLYLQRERNINQLRRRAVRQPANVDHRGSRPYKGYGVIRLGGERRRARCTTACS